MDIEKAIADITQQIIEKYKPKKIILFGSAAEGKSTTDSDIDFLIIKKDVPHHGIDRMRELSKLIERSIGVDFLIYKPEEIEERLKLGDPFIKNILKEGKSLYG